MSFDEQEMPLADVVRGYRVRQAKRRNRVVHEDQLVFVQLCDETPAQKELVVGRYKQLPSERTALTSDEWKFYGQAAYYHDLDGYESFGVQGQEAIEAFVKWLATFGLRQRTNLFRNFPRLHVENLGRTYNN